MTVRLFDASGDESAKKSFDESLANPLAARHEARVQGRGDASSEDRREHSPAASNASAPRNPRAWTLVQRAENARKRGEDAAGERSTAAEQLLFKPTRRRPPPRHSTRRGANRSRSVEIAFVRARIAAPLDAKALTDSGIAYATGPSERSSRAAGAYESRGALRYQAVPDGLVTSGAR